MKFSFVYELTCTIELKNIRGAKLIDMNVLWGLASSLSIKIKESIWKIHANNPIEPTFSPNI